MLWLVMVFLTCLATVVLPEPEPPAMPMMN